jgi:predicted DNA-binding WGR domain protein
LDSGCFDVVIFDEASQITLEEAVPSLFRASQAIVVGDEMQLPPTTFFAAKPTDDDEDLVVEEDGELVSYELQSNSFLNHAARNLPPTMLGWHYRSRSESLISFSNWAFYEGRLLTVPEEQLPPTGRPPLIAQSATDAELGADELVTRPISFHFLRHGVYEQRRNAAEAEYIAHLVRRLLTSHPDRSIGIVAFSEAQQSEIDEALTQLAREDAEFASRYEAELEREVDGQHVGLLVKNLENIQGDERDIIILSVCYGPDASGKMRMNFGPINMACGEKRLNVAFSRAKHHMAVVSSIHFSDITNDFNEGAACFKNYLRYAEAVSEGRSDAASRVLHGLCRWHGAQQQEAEVARDAVSEQLAAVLVRNGLLVDRGVGQSHFRCDLAARRPGEATYRLGILVDGDAYYEQADVLERDVMRPKLLKAFGWNVCQVFAKDWHQDRERVLEYVMRRIAGDPDTEGDEVDGKAASKSDVPDHEGSASEWSGEELSLELESGPAPYQPLADAVEVFTPRDKALNSAQAVATTRYFEFRSDTSSKFWEITLSGTRHSVRFGRIGAAGQEAVKDFADESRAHRDADALIRQKLAKGYLEVPRPGETL